MLPSDRIQLNPLILEHDALTHPHTFNYATHHAEELLSADITLCSVNQNSFLVHTDGRNVSHAKFVSPQHPSLERIDKALQATNVSRVESDKSSHGFWSASCYFVSPKGAKRLLGSQNRKALPLRLDHIFQYNPSVPGGWPPLGKPDILAPFAPIKSLIQSTLDMRLNALYHVMNARLLQPALAYSPNDPSTSTTVKVDSGASARNQRLERNEIVELLAGRGPRPATLKGQVAATVCNEE